jgi:hypothetical protein
MATTLHMKRIIAPVLRICAFGTCAALAALAPSLSDSLGIQARSDSVVRYAPLAETAGTLPGHSAKPSSVNTDRIKAVWETDVHPASPGSPADVTSPAPEPGIAFQTAGG